MFTSRNDEIGLCRWEKYPYVYVDGIYLRRNWGGEYENVAILLAIAVNEDGYREVLGAVEGFKEDKASWTNFFQCLRGRGLNGVKLIVGDKCMGILEAVGRSFLRLNTSAAQFTFTAMSSLCTWIQGEIGIQKCLKSFTPKRAGKLPEKRPKLSLKNCVQ